jgi:hypothetical protein
VRVRGYPSQYPYTTPHCKAVYVGAENGLGIGEGVPIAIRCRGGPYQGQGVGTVWASKESLVGPVSAGLHPSPGAQPSADILVKQAGAYLAALGIQVRRSGGGDIDQDSLALSTRCGGGALGPPDQVE